jgi:hypothetical protein
VFDSPKIYNASITQVFARWPIKIKALLVGSIDCVLDSSLVVSDCITLSSKISYADKSRSLVSTVRTTAPALLWL